MADDLDNVENYADRMCGRVLIKKTAPAVFHRVLGASDNKKKIIIFGGGLNRIGQGIEFELLCNLS